MINHLPVQDTYQFHTFQCPGKTGWYKKMLSWLQQFSIFCLLDPCGYKDPDYRFKKIAAAGAMRCFEAEPGNAFATLEAATATNEWLFGHIGYDCKNEVETLHSGLPGYTGFPGLFFFQPEIIIMMQEDEVEIASLTQPAESIWKEINNTPPAYSISHPGHLNSRFTKEEYIDTVNLLKQHIHRGDCYEINFCQEFFSENADIDPQAAWTALTAASPNPFSGFYRLNDRYLICASPERFLQKNGNTLVSQPIKGTWKRSRNSEQSDEAERRALQENAKERSENIMVADLVRNDLSKICRSGSVSVTELCSAYTFPQVHHLVSTITGKLEPGTSITNIMKAMFPMGSMTGAPKKKVMELVEQYEQTKRGIFSGALGYITPQQDFDFNVVIRSMMYNATSKYLSYLAGSGITFYCDAEKEYEECLLKAQAIEAVLNANR